MNARHWAWSWALAIVIGGLPMMTFAQGDKGGKGGDKPAAGPGGGGGGGRANPPGPGPGGPGPGRPGPGPGANPGGGRPNLPNPPPKVDRPATPPPKVDRPATPPPKVDRPATPPNRPETPRVDTPRPTLPGAGLPGRDRPERPERPTTPNRPDNEPNRVQKPTLPDRPGLTDRPGPDRPGADRPSGDRPRDGKPNFDRPGINRPDLDRPGLIDRPGAGDRPERPVRPGIGDRPELPGRPDAGDRPTRPDPDRPNLGDRPGVIDRPGVGERPERPDRPDRPDVIDRPGDGRPDFNRPARPERPSGDAVVNRPGANRPNFNRPDRPSKPIFNTNLFNNGSFQIGLQPNRPNWGVGGNRNSFYAGHGHNHHWHNNNWGDHWHRSYVHNHYHGWYHGPWQGRWGANWYSPVLWAGARYGVGSWWLPGYWGYGASYYNPYYVVGSGYDYSQPVVINQYVVDDSAPEALRVAERPSGEERAFALFDEGLELFKAGRYPQAYLRIDEAQRLLPGDPVLHEVKALTLFAVGKYDEAAAVLNALLASSPGMDWTSMSKLYGDEREYTTQLRQLETFVADHPRDAGPIFVLAYHYLVIGEDDSATRMLKAVVARQPEDLTARRMLDALTAPEAPAAPVAERDPPAKDVKTELVGEWSAKNEEATVDLVVEGDGRFTWRAKPRNAEAVTVSGTISADGNSLALESKEQGTMVGTITPLGANRFNFVMAGSPSGDKGLDFERR